MKSKTPGLHVGKQQAPAALRRDALTAGLSFIALAGLLVTVSGLTAVLPLFISGLACLAVFTLARHLHRGTVLLPAALAALIAIVCFARTALLNGFGALWNETRSLWAAGKGILLPLAETDGSGLWLAGALCGLLLAALSLLLAKAPALTAALLICLTSAAGLVHITPWLFASAGIAILLLAWQKSAVSALSFLLSGAVVLGIAALTLQPGTVQRLSQTAKDALHHWRYEKPAEILPEGDLSSPVIKPEGTDTVLSVTSDRAETLYLRGFVGDVYENGKWKPISSQFSAEAKDLFYWLHENGFYPQSQFACSAVQTAEYETQTIRISNFSACSLYRYEPFSVLPDGAGTAKNRLAPSAVTTRGWNGERTYSYTAIADAGTILQQILDELQQNETSGGYLRMESAYRDFVDSYARSVPQEFLDEMGALLEETKQALGVSGELSKEQAQLCALAFLESCFDGHTALPLDGTAGGTTYQYAAVAALALREYGIPARYAEGFIVKTGANETVSVTGENAGAWVEVYQDGVGWLPLALTPGLESLAPEQTESGIRPVGVGEGDGTGPRITEGQEPEQQDAEQSEDSDNTPDGGQRTGLLAKPALWLLLALGILLLLLAGILIRHHVILKNRRRAFDDPDNSGAASSLFADAAGLLSALGLERGGGSMLALCGPVSERFGEETADTFRAMAALNEKALFSSRTLDAAERENMRNFHGTVLNLLKTNTKWPRKLRLKWLNCLY